MAADTTPIKIALPGAFIAPIQKPGGPNVGAQPVAPPVRPGTIDPNMSAPDLQAAITREQWQHFQNTYRPAEDAAFALLDRDISGDVSHAQNVVRAAYDRGQAMQGRALHQSGRRVSDAEARAMERRRGLQRALDIAGVSNNMRRAWEDQRLQGLADMLSIGKGIAGSAGEMANSAASLATARQSAYEQAKANYKANQMSAAGTMAGLALAAAMMM